MRTYEEYLAMRNNPLQYSDGVGLRVYSIGVSISGAFVGAWSINLGIAFSYDRERGVEIGLYSGTGPGAGVPSAAIGIQMMGSEKASSVDALSGGSTAVGAGGKWVIGITTDVVVPTDAECGYSFKSLTISASTPGVESHIYYTETKVWKWKLFDGRIEEGHSETK